MLNKYIDEFEKLVLIFPETSNNTQTSPSILPLNFKLNSKVAMTLYQ